VGQTGRHCTLGLESSPQPTHISPHPILAPTHPPTHPHPPHQPHPRVIQHGLQAGEAERFYFFNSFFFKKLTEKEKRGAAAAASKGEDKARRDHERVKKWTKVRGAGCRRSWRWVAGARAGGGERVLCGCLASAKLEQPAPAPARPCPATCSHTLQPQHRPPCTIPPHTTQPPHTDPPTQQDVDIFSRDFLFIPIHDALHWSLLIVCYPGELGNNCLEQQQRLEEEKRQQQQPAWAGGGGGGGSGSGGNGGSPGLAGDADVEVVGTTYGPQQQQPSQQQPSQPSQPSQHQSGGGGSQRPAAALPPLKRRACILHLDSLGEGEWLGWVGLGWVDSVLGG